MKLIQFLIAILLPLSWTLTFLSVQLLSTTERKAPESFFLPSVVLNYGIGFFVALFPALLIYLKKIQRFYSWIFSFIFISAFFAVYSYYTQIYAYLTILWNAIIIGLSLAFILQENNPEEFIKLDRSLLVKIALSSGLLYFFWCSILTLHFIGIQSQGVLWNNQKLEAFWMTGYTGICVLLLIVLAIYVKPQKILWQNLNRQLKEWSKQSLIWKNLLDEYPEKNSPFLMQILKNFLAMPNSDWTKSQLEILKNIVHLAQDQKNPDLSLLSAALEVFYSKKCVEKKFSQQLKLHNLNSQNNLIFLIIPLLIQNQKSILSAVKIFTDQSDTFFNQKSAVNLRFFAEDFFSHIYHPLVKHKSDMILEIEKGNKELILKYFAVSLTTFDKINTVIPIFVWEKNIVEKMIDDLNSPKSDLNQTLNNYRLWLLSMQPKTVFLQEVFVKYKTDLPILLNRLSVQFKDYFETQIIVPDDLFSSAVVIAQSQSYFCALHQLFDNTRRYACGLSKKNYLTARFYRQDRFIFCEIQDSGPGLQKVENLFRPGKGLQETKSLIERQGDSFYWKQSSCFEIRFAADSIFPSF